MHLLQFGVVPDRRFEPERLADVETTSALIGWRATTPLD